MEHVPDGGARLVDAGDDGVAQRGQAAHVVHDVQRGKRVQACSATPTRIMSLPTKRTIWKILVGSLQPEATEAYVRSRWPLQRRA